MDFLSKSLFLFISAGVLFFTEYFFIYLTVFTIKIVWDDFLVEHFKSFPMIISRANKHSIFTSYFVFNNQLSAQSFSVWIYAGFNKLWRWSSKPGIYIQPVRFISKIAGAMYRMNKLVLRGGITFGKIKAIQPILVIKPATLVLKSKINEE